MVDLGKVCATKSACIHLTPAPQTRREPDFHMCTAGSTPKNKKNGVQKFNRPVKGIAFEIHKQCDRTVEEFLEIKTRPSLERRNQDGQHPKPHPSIGVIHA